MLDDSARAEFFRRSYTAVDGLWFMKTEERLGFDETLELDAAVWSVLPKIQARTMRALSGLGEGLESLRECLRCKMRWEDFDFREEPLGGDLRGFQFRITKCPWVELLRKSGREHLAERVGARICPLEYGTWAREFGETITFHLESGGCGSGGECRLRFTEDSRRPENKPDVS